MIRFGERAQEPLLGEIHLSALQEEMEIASMRFGIPGPGCAGVASGLETIESLVALSAQTVL